jgi:hypothetical protein
VTMIVDSVPGLKRCLAFTGWAESTRTLMSRVIIAFIMHAGRMSCLQAAGAVRSEAVHRAQISRFLGRPRWRAVDGNGLLRLQLLSLESAAGGLFIFILDATLTSRSGRKTANTFSTGNRQRRPQKRRRHGKIKHAKKSCHSFTMGLLITPSGVRIPFSKPYYTKEYCRQTGRQHRTTAESAAELIRELPLPAGARVIVLGDTAYDADVVQQACAQRRYSWITPSNSERVLAGPQGKRPKVRSLLKDWSTWSRQTIKVAPTQGKYVAYRRLSPHRIGPKVKPRTYDVHQERLTVRSVGEVRLVFSTTKTNLQTATPDDVKILMTNDLGLTARDIVELYALRWQIELFFKELKSTLGFAQYRFQQFEAVEAWTELALTTFLYLEWHRAKQLARRDLSEEQQRWWRCQRTHGLCQAVRQASEQNELRYLADRLQTPGGLRKLKQILKRSVTREYQAAGGAAC